jgi:hypothetical protein
MLTTSIDALDPNNTSRIDGLAEGEGPTPRDGFGAWSFGPVLEHGETVTGYRDQDDTQ